MRVEDALRETSTGLEIPVRCQPGAARSGIVGLHGDCLKVKVKSPATEGRANQELVLLIADVLGVRPRSVTLLSGHQSRLKRLRVEGITLNEAAKKLGAFIAPSLGL